MAAVLALMPADLTPFQNLHDVLVWAKVAQPMWAAICGELGDSTMQDFVDIAAVETGAWRDVLARYMP